ncbi:MAG: PIN domain-containing protein [Gemmatimonadales bacterium]
MIVADSSVAIAAVLANHPDHDAARLTVLADRPRLVAHAAFEAYSVLTRMPLPHRLHPGDARTVLDRAFPKDPVVLGARALRALLGRLADASISGGAVYDGLVAGTAEAHGAELVTLDRRAEPVYRTLGANVRWLVDETEG